MTLKVGPDLPMSYHDLPVRSNRRLVKRFERFNQFNRRGKFSESDVDETI